MLLLISILFTLWGGGQAIAFDLQEALSEAQAGDVILVPAGEYEGPLVIEQPVVLQAEQGAVLVNERDESTLVLQTDRAEIQGLTIVHRHHKLDIPAVTVNGNRNILTELTIETSGMGIALQDANENELRDIKIVGSVRERSASSSMSAREGNGIDLFRSHDNVLELLDIRGVQDGVYIERSRGNIVRECVVTNSRYGFHLMFTEQTMLTQNESFGNITGAMVMGTQGTVVEQNQFYKQSSHVFSQGLKLYDVQSAVVTDNVIEENLVGLYIDSSFENEIKDNNISHNYIGIDMNRSERNQLQYNQVIGNMIPARAAQSTDNEIRFNYWEQHKGIDLTGDRVSEMPFHADLIFSAIVGSKSIYQIFADSPGMLFLQLLLDVDRKAAFADTAPMMDMDKLHGASESRKDVLEVVVYVVALLVSMITIMIGGRKKWINQRNV